VTALVAIVMYCTPTPPVLPKPARDIPGVIAYADVDVRYARGAVTILKVRPGKFAQPTSLPRFRGRFVAIVSKGQGAKMTSLLELEFDFPLLAEAESSDATTEARALAERLRKGVTSTTTVRVPILPDADTVGVWDSVSRKTVTAPLAREPEAAPPARAPLSR
jgi:hypothetical protein